MAPSLSLRPKPPVFAATGLKGVAGFATFEIHPQAVAAARPAKERARARATRPENATSS